MSIKDELNFPGRNILPEEKIELFHKVIESDKLDFPNMSKEDLICYIICLDHFLGAKKEFYANLYLNLRFGEEVKDS